MSMPSDTICAIATPPGQGGLGVVRLSGPRVRNILKHLWRGKTPVDFLEPKKLYLGVIIGGSSSSAVDRALAVFMPGPATYTGEDVVEISCHGSPTVLGEILGACIAHGARLATPGEFTRRAFLAGKLDLVQAEGVADLIAATSTRAARLASDQLAGRLSTDVRSISEKIAALRAEIEAAIDFPDEGIDIPSATATRNALTELLAAIDRLRASFREGRLVRDGVRVAIAGAPNAGKSSLLNRLADCERAIVHHAPGTTRDVVEESVSLGGIVFRLRDTAGIRSNAGEVETLGISRTHEELAAADLVLAIFDGSRPWCDDDDAVVQALAPAKTIVVQNKADLSRATGTTPLARRFRPSPPVQTSAKTGIGIDALSERLVAFFSADPTAGENAVVTNIRHKTLLDDTAGHLAGAVASLSSSEPPECLAQHLRSAQDALGQITGAVTTEALLDRIFSQFCIGK